MRNDNRFTPISGIPVGKGVPQRREEWLNPAATKELRGAVAKRAKSVVIKGLTYDLSYGHYFPSVLLNKDYEAVRVRRADGGFVPFAYVRIDKLLV